MARPRSTFAKIQRDQAKRARARAKQEDRLARSAARETDDPAPAHAAGDQAALLEELARLHADRADGRISEEDFDLRQEALRSQLHID